MKLFYLIFIFLSVTLIACDRYDKNPETILGMKLGLDINEQVKIAESNGIRGINYNITDDLKGNVTVSGVYNDTGAMILSEIILKIYNENYGWARNRYDRLQPVIDEYDKEHIISIYESKYGKCIPIEGSKFSYCDMGQGSWKTGSPNELMGECYYWNIGHLRVSLSFQEYENMRGQYSTTSIYSFDCKLADEYLKRSDGNKSKAKQLKEKSNKRI